MCLLRLLRGVCSTQPGVYIYVDETIWSGHGGGRLPVSKTRNSLEALNNTTAAICTVGTVYLFLLTNHGMLLFL